MSDYRSGKGPLPSVNRFWPLYGAGFDNLGRDGQPIKAELPQPGPGELLVRYDACGLCLSDTKVIRLGQDHPRIYRDMQADPVVLGHEASFTVVAVGKGLRDEYHVGDRFTVQADVWYEGVNLAFGYEIDGALAQYGVIDRRILAGDHGNYLVPVAPGTGYAESALTEPWACVVAAYQLTYRAGIKAGGTTWVVGTPAAGDLPYTISAGFDEKSHPARLLLSRVPAAFDAWLRSRARSLDVEVIDVDDPATPPVEHEEVDDVIVLGSDAGVVEGVSPYLAQHGILAVVSEEPFGRKVHVDVGRIHYNRWLYAGGTVADVARAYSDVPARSSLKPGGQAWFVGAGGPMGRMHVQHAIEASDGPAAVVCTDVSVERLAALHATFAAEAQAKDVDFVCLNPAERQEYEAGMAPFRDDGFDDVIVLVPIPAVIADAATWAARGGVVNVFAGAARGTMVEIELGDVLLRDVRVIGHSSSSIEDLRRMLHLAETGQLSPNRSVAAIGSLAAARDGLRAVTDAVFPGKVVIYPHIRDLPLTALPDLQDVLPTVYARLKDGREWTNEAEQQLLQEML